MLPRYNFPLSFLLLWVKSLSRVTTQIIQRFENVQVEYTYLRFGKEKYMVEIRLMDPIRSMALNMAESMERDFLQDIHSTKVFVRQLAVIMVHSINGCLYTWSREIAVTFLLKWGYKNWMLTFSQRKHQLIFVVFN